MKPSFGKCEKYIGSGIVLGIAICCLACTAVPKLSKKEKIIIHEVLQNPIPEMILGKTGFANVPGHQIWFEYQMPNGDYKGTVVLIMGNGNDAFTWPQQFIARFLEHGYGVIRYDHRETGLSISAKKRKAKRAYSLKDMAGDVIAILDTAQIEKVHVIGVSMGGMIGQLLAIDFPERIRTLTSIMSSADITDPELPPMSRAVFPKMIKTVFKHGLFGNHKGQIKRQIVHRKILMGTATGDIDTKAMAQAAAYNLKRRRGYNLLSARYHFKAIQASRPRYERLSNAPVPLLLIHGKQDPVMPISHSQKLARTIPDSDTLWIENMGHDLPDAALEPITNKIITHFEHHD